MSDTTEWNGKLNRIQAIEIFDSLTNQDDPFWENLVEDYYDEESDTMPSIYHVFAALGVTEQEYKDATGADNVYWPIEVSSPHLTPEMHAQFIEVIRINLLSMADGIDNPHYFEIIRISTLGFIDNLVLAYSDKEVNEFLKMLAELWKALNTARAANGPTQFDEPLQKIADALATLQGRSYGSA